MEDLTLEDCRKMTERKLKSIIINNRISEIGRAMSGWLECERRANLEVVDSDKYIDYINLSNNFKVNFLSAIKSIYQDLWIGDEWIKDEDS